MKTYKKCMDALAFVEKLVLAASTMLILVLTVGNVFSRKVIHQSWSFTEELVVAVFVLITLMAAALACREGELVNLTLLTDRLPRSLRKPSVIVITVLSMECYKRWGADATNMNWSETYTALQQKTVEGQENPLPAIDAASVQEVQPYCSMWNANYDCLFFCINQKIYDSLTPKQQAVIDECGRLATEYQRYMNRAGDEEIISRWSQKNGVSFLPYEDLDIDSFKTAVEGIDEWYIGKLEEQSYGDGRELVEIFRK